MSGLRRVADRGGLGIPPTQGMTAPTIQTENLNFILQDQVEMADLHVYNLGNGKSILFLQFATHSVNQQVL